jgi:hypothetical protein
MMGDMGSIGTRACLVAALVSTAACRETRVDFVAEQAFIDLERDSGEVVLGSGASVHVRTRAYAGFTVRAAGLVQGDRVEPIEDTGRIVVRGRLEVEVDASVDLSVGAFDGPVDTVEHEFSTEIGSFDPFLLGESVTVVLGLPVKDIIRARILPGVFLVLETAPGTFIPTFEGVCLEVEGDAVQYTGMIAIEPDIRYQASIEVAVPLGGVDIIGPVGIELDFPPLVSLPLDLGTFSMSSGAPVQGVQPCDGVEPMATFSDGGESSSGG